MPSGLDSFRWRRDAPLRAGPLVRRRPFRVCFVPSTDKRPSGDGRLSTVKSVHSSVTTRTFDAAVFYASRGYRREYIRTRAFRTKAIIRSVRRQNLDIRNKNQVTTIQIYFDNSYAEDERGFFQNYLVTRRARSRPPCYSL